VRYLLIILINLLSRGGSPVQALGVARGQVEQGCHIIDINLDDALIDSQKARPYPSSLAARPQPVVTPLARRVPLPRHPHSSCPTADYPLCWARLLVLRSSIGHGRVCCNARERPGRGAPAHHDRLVLVGHPRRRPQSYPGLPPRPADAYSSRVVAN